jgi:pimeloyl-ACP methyl ester carboxylesterase
MEDLQEAMDELKDMADVKTTALVGMRLGAAVGAQMAQRNDDVDRLVLWDPVVDGAEYIDALLGESGTRLSKAYPDHLAEDGTEIPEVLGFPLTPQMRKGIETLHPNLLRSGLPPTLLVSTVSDPDRYAPIKKELELGGGEWSEIRFEGPEAWVEEGNLGTTGLPVAAIRRITEWLS